LIVLAAVLALAPVAQAQLYKYVDKNGKTVYSDQPPPDVESKQMRVPNTRSSAPAKSAVERDKELDKSRKEGSEKQKKADEAADKAAQAARRCEQARIAHQTYVDGGRISKYEKGERVLMSDEEIEAARERSRQEMEEACKTQ
jgi:hypothetical protein